MTPKISFQNYEQFQKDVDILDEIEHKRTLKALDKLRKNLEDKKIIKPKSNENRN